MKMLLLGIWTLLALIPCSGTTEEIFEVSVWPNPALVKFGQSLTINCSTTCPDPGPSGIETFFKKTQLAKGPQWKEFLLEDITEDSVLQCFFSCAGVQKDAVLDITMYQPPEQVILDLQPEWVTTEEAFTVKCHVPSVAPLQSLTLTLLQGDQELHRKDFMSASAASQRAEVAVNVRAQRENDKCNFSCRAELDLSPQGGGLFHGSSATKELRIFAVFRMFLEDQELSPFSSWKGDAAWASATILAMETGDQELTCLVSLGPVEQKVRRPVHVYSFPPPILEVEDAYPLAGTDVNVTCSGHVLTSPSPTLRLEGAPNLSAPGESAWLLFTAREEDDGRNLSCEASLEVQGRRLLKTTEIQLHVLYKPRFEESSCPGNQIWVEGMDQMLACIPEGNPAPALVCIWNGVIIDLDVPQKATQNHTGTYCCTATNQLGSVSKDIAVIVQGLHEGITSSTIFIIIISTLGMAVITITLYLNYQPCKRNRRKRAPRQREQNKDEESQFADIQAEECSSHYC
ncbi:intercellular adhesion molecule 5 isoform X2 [Mesocricetus auratus]|uniref:Intercellular adhesion molecule 5 isoform X2 n=1 Tax=Mesocricetus auratus TaxID=10036 RepID=A0ABM2XT49_MESAU|nr:intercellular adhesion molecule 5 isoform X2 [Mesocricetus auratus]